MKVNIYCDERYPYYDLDKWDKTRFGYSVHRRTVERWERVMAEFAKVQGEMEALSMRPMREFKS